MECSIRNLGEWASEGKSKAQVDETERILRYQIKHMTVCDERMYDYSIKPGGTAGG